MYKTLRLIIPILFLAFFSCEEEPVDPVIANAEDVIQENSELFGLIQRVALNENTGSDITCIDFIYPFTIFTYDEDLMFIDDQRISNDAEFSDFLGNVQPGHSISLSLPITAELDNGLSLSIHTYEELKEAIDNCVDEDFLAFCNATIIDQFEECVWEVTSAGPYQGGFFSMNPNGSVTLNHNGQELNGTWIFLVIEGDVHLNINLEGLGPAAIYWNFDWLVNNAQENLFEIDNDLGTVTLQRSCESTCNTLVFEACEDAPGSGQAEFDLTSYEACILNLEGIQDPSTVIVSYHLSEADAQGNLNAIAGTYTNLQNPQDIYVRIEDIMTGNASIVTISIAAITC